MKMISKLSIPLTLFGLVLCGGCQLFTSSTAKGATNSSGPSTTAVRGAGNIAAISVVKNGILTGHKKTTVGEAFGGTFQNPKWTSFDTPKGETVVEFNGTITLEAIKRSRSSFGIRASCIASLGLADEIKQIKEREHKKYDYTNDSVEGAATAEAAATKLPQETEAIAQAQATIDGKIAECSKNDPLPVRFEFALSANKETFNIVYINGNEGAQANRVLAFIYR
jgi:hypothetical protein